jgi:aldose 1-epimerase
MTLPREPFGHLPDGTQASVLTLENESLRVRVTNYGGRMVSIEAPDRSGQRGHVLLGFDNVHAFATAGGSFGALLGRCANRIAGGQAEIDGTTCQLVRNDNGNTLHGGPVGFDKVVWQVTEAADQLVLTYVSPDGDQGFPGEMTAQATYRLEGDALYLDLQAHTTKPTIANLSAHPYFNLANAGTGDILDHVLTIESDSFLPTDAQQIPTGEIRPVQDTPFDFRRPTPIGARIRTADEQLLYGNGYDHCWTLPATGQLRLAARMHAPATGRVLELYTDQPGLQFYSGNKLNGSVVGRNNVIYRQSAGFALEAQGYPDAPHHPNFASTILRPNETYRRGIRYRFAAV